MLRLPAAIAVATAAASTHVNCCLDCVYKADVGQNAKGKMPTCHERVIVANPVITDERNAIDEMTTQEIERELARRRASLWQKEREEVIATCIAMDASGINQGTSGNVSVRVDGGFLITPSGLPYHTMRPDQVVFMDLEGGYYGDFLPSSEWRMHYDVYKAKPAAKAIVHAHPTFCTAMSAQRRNIPAFHYMVGIAGGKEVRCADYATFGSQELSDSVLAAFGEDTKACLMANHGMICFDKSLSSALKLAVEVECLAKQFTTSMSFVSTMGPPTILGDEEMDVILAKFKTYGKQAGEVAAMSSFQQEHAVVPPPRRDQPSPAAPAAPAASAKNAKAPLKASKQAAPAPASPASKAGMPTILEVAAAGADRSQGGTQRSQLDLDVVLNSPGTGGYMVAAGTLVLLLTIAARRLVLRPKQRASQYVFIDGAWRRK